MVRGVELETIFQHATQALDCGCPVDVRWFFNPETLRVLSDEIGSERPEQINPLLARLPQGFRYDEVQLYLRCREHGGG